MRGIDKGPSLPPLGDLELVSDLWFWTPSPYATFLQQLLFFLAGVKGTDDDKHMGTQ